jgi:hypothetical protein
MQEFDVNQDGKFSYDEFANFLDGFVNSVLGDRGTTSQGRGSASSASSVLSGNNLYSATPVVSAASTPTSPTSASLPPVLVGWDQAKWTDTTHTTVKYVAGRIMAQYSPSDWLNPDKQAAILSAFKAAGLKPTALGKDQVDFGDGNGPIDIVFAANEGGRAWQWCPVDPTK